MVHWKFQSGTALIGSILIRRLAQLGTDCLQALVFITNCSKLINETSNWIFAYTPIYRLTFLRNLIKNFYCKAIIVKFVNSMLSCTRPCPRTPRRWSETHKKLTTRKSQRQLMPSRSPVDSVLWLKVSLIEHSSLQLFNWHCSMRLLFNFPSLVSLVFLFSFSI